jgi:nitroreductase
MSVPGSTRDALEFIKSRRSVRKYTDEPVAAEDIQKLLEAAMAAPSGRNVRPWEFVVVTDPAVCERLSHSHPASALVAWAPLVIVVCGREVDSHHWIVDGAAAAENILLEAVSLGLGGVWIGVFPVPEREAHVRQVIGLPEGVRPLCMVPVGHPAESPEPRTQYDAAHVHYDRY